jgi:hypothetical protein
MNQEVVVLGMSDSIPDDCLWGKFTNAVVNCDSPRSLSGRARRRRWNHFEHIFPGIREMAVLDLGGTGHFWEHSPFRPKRVVTVNLSPDESRYPEHTHVQGDACNPASLPRSDFDLVFSNSLIEHVGGHIQRQRLARIVRSYAPRYWIQTPYRYFPLEPHWMMPGVQFLPFSARVAVTRSWRLGHRYSPDRDKATKLVAEIELLSICQMRSYFPDAFVWIEKALCLPKSLVAIKAGPKAHCPKDQVE